jgi:hypothetical protein
MGSTLHGFSAEEALSQIMLAEMQHRKSHSTSIEESSADVVVISRMRANQSLDVVPFTFMEKLSIVAAKVADEQRAYVKESRMILHSVGIGISKGLGMALITQEKGEHTVALNSPLHIAAYTGCCDYVEFKIRNDPTATNTHRKISLLYLCIWRQLSSSIDSSQSLHLIDLLYDKGLHVNQPITFHPPHVKPLQDGTEHKVTIWTYTILEVIVQIYTRGSYDRPSRVAQLIERHLELGADRCFWIQIYKRDPRPRSLKYGGGVKLGPVAPQNSHDGQKSQQHNQMPTTLGGADVSRSKDLSQLEHPLIQFEEQSIGERFPLPPPNLTLPASMIFELRCGEGQCTPIKLEWQGPPSHSDFKIDSSGQISLRDLFEKWNPHNKARLIELLDEDEVAFGKEVTAEDLKQGAVLPQPTKPDDLAVSATNQQSEQASLQSLRINQPEIVTSEVLESKMNEARSETGTNEHITETGKPKSAAPISQFVVLFFVLSK